MPSFSQLRMTLTTASAAVESYWLEMERYYVDAFSAVSLQKVKDKKLNYCSLSLLRKYHTLIIIKQDRKHSRTGAEVIENPAYKMTYIVKSQYKWGIVWQVFMQPITLWGQTGIIPLCERRKVGRPSKDSDCSVKSQTHTMRQRGGLCWVMTEKWQRSNIWLHFIDIWDYKAESRIS